MGTKDLKLEDDKLKAILAIKSVERHGPLPWMALTICRGVSTFSMWPFLINVWLGQGSCSTDISVAVRCPHYDAVNMSFLSRVLRSCLWDANRRDGSSTQLRLRHPESKYFDVSSLTEYSKFQFLILLSSVVREQQARWSPGNTSIAPCHKCLHYTDCEMEESEGNTLEVPELREQSLCLCVPGPTSSSLCYSIFFPRVI